MSPSMRVARRRSMPLPQVFATTRFPDVAQIMENALALFPDFPEMTEVAQARLFPAVNVTEDPTTFTVTAELPGLTANDVRIDFTDGVLTIQGEMTEERTEKDDDKKYHVWGRRSGSFQRSFPFPGGIADDKIAAEFKDGVLTIHLPKATEEQARRRPIKITTK